MPAVLPSVPTAPVFPDDLLAAVLEVSLTALQLWRPLYGPGGEPTDFALDYLNPAGQRMLGLPERPGGTMLARYPHVRPTGIFDFYCRVLATGQAGRYDVNYQADGLDNYYHIAARRCGELLLVSFTDTADHGRSAVEAALRASQARERTDLAEAEAQRGELQRLFEQAPVAVAMFRGPTYVVEWANPAVCALWGRTPAQTLRTPLFELLPEAAGQGFEELLDGVLATGVPYVAHELPALIDRQGRRDTVYWNFVYQPRREADGRITGVTVVATDVSEQVQARQQVQDLNQQLAAANAALLATNAELGAHNAELRRVHQHLQRLNQTLDARVAERTQAAQAARAEAEQQRTRLERLFMAAPAAICVLAGPELVYELVNPVYQQLMPGRPLLGRPLREAQPELATHAAMDMLRQVYATGAAHAQQGLRVPVAHPSGNGTLEDRYFNLVYQARYGEQQRIDGVLVFAFEVTEQVAARDAATAAAAQLRLITDALPVLIGYLDRDQKYRFANRAYEAWFGQKPQALLGRSVREIVGEPAYAQARGYIERALAGERLDFEARMPYREDFVKHIRTSFVPDVRDGAVAGFYSLVSDITEQVESRAEIERQQQVLQGLNQQSTALNDKLFAANAALASANEELGQSNDELGDTNQALARTNVDLDTFVYTASHDLKGPITNLEGLLRALWEELPAASRSQPVAYIMEMMQSSVDRFQNTLAHLGAISHLQQERGQLLAPARLAEVIRDVRLDLAPLLEAAGGRVVVDVQGFPAFPFTEGNLRSVVYNLLSNALKYRHPDRPPLVRLSCRHEAPYWVLEVADNGLGLALTPDRPLFGLFQRYHTHVEGSGVGLYMVKKMVENAGGKVEVQSQLGVGSTFSVYFKY